MDNEFIFVNVDTQKDFLLPTGKLYIKGVEEILPNLAKLTNFAVHNNITVISTGDYHNLTDEEISDKPDFINTFPAHCIFTEEGSEFVNETYPKLIHRHYNLIPPNQRGELMKENLKRAKDIILFKNKFDVFEGNPYTNEVLNILKPKLAYIYGVVTEICVKYVVEGLLKRNILVTVVEDAVKELNTETKNKLFKEWEDRGVMFINTDEVMGRGIYRQ